MVNCDQILSEASLGWGKSCNRFLARLDWNSGFHGNRKLRQSYNGKKLVTTLALFFILSGNEDIHNISNEFEIRSDRTKDCGVNCP